MASGRVAPEPPGTTNERNRSGVDGRGVQAISNCLRVGGQVCLPDWFEGDTDGEVAVDTHRPQEGVEGFRDRSCHIGGCGRNNSAEHLEQACGEIEAEHEADQPPAECQYGTRDEGCECSGDCRGNAIGHLDDKVCVS